MWFVDGRRPGPAVSPRAPGRLRGVSAVLAADGFQSSLVQAAGMDPVEHGGKEGSSIGLICNINLTHGEEEKKLKSFGVAYQYFQAAFESLRRETGADLENIVYIKG